MSEAGSAPSAESPDRFRAIRMTGLVLLFLFLVGILTVFKIPEQRLTGLLQGYMQSALDPYDIYVSDRGRSLSFFPRPEYRLEEPVLEMADQSRIELDGLSLRPNLLALFTGRAGAKATLHRGNSEIVIDGSGNPSRADAKVSLKEIDLGKFGVLGFAGIKGNGLVDGIMTIEGAISELSTLNGLVELKLKNLRLEEQSIFGFKIPETLVSEGTIQIEIRSGKLFMKRVQLGRQNDDLTATVTGDLALNRNLKK
jgi:type II secretion system protein N